MTKKIVHDLAQISFKNNNLDEDMTNRIANKLKRRELKAYIHALKEAIRKNTVQVNTSQTVSKQMRNMFETTYKGKNLEFIVKPDILLGTRIIDNDMVYDSTLQNTFNNIMTYVRE